MSSPLLHTPLLHQTILVTRAAGQSSQFSQLLRQAGATALELPALQILPPSSWALLDQAIVQLDQFDWLMLTSTNGVEAFCTRLAAQGRDITALDSLKIAVVGQKTAACLQMQGRAPDFIPPDFVADSLVEQFPVEVAGLRLLFPRVETGGREQLVKDLTRQGAAVTEVPAYQSGCATRMPPEIMAALQQDQINIITFASSKTVACFNRLLQAYNLTVLDHLCLASIGPQTSLTCQDCFGRVDLEAATYTLEGLTQAIIDFAMASDRE